VYFPSLKYLPAAEKPIFLYNYIPINEAPIGIEPEPTLQTEDGDGSV
jgi:hypothetical protein